MNLLKCLLTNNACYKAGETIKPKGVMVHSTGANNPTLKRYVQPAKDDANRAELLGQLGTNKNSNDWNNTTRQVCVHAFIGKLADGSVAAVQTLPWNLRGWHSGRGSKGSANDTHISFEICEDGLTDQAYFDKVYTEAVELTAMLCKEYSLDPLADGVVICHSEGAKRGVASNHADVMHWFPKHGKSMDTFRADVKKAMGSQAEPEPVKLDAARYYSAVYSRGYTVKAKGGLNLRSGAGANKTLLAVLPQGTKFRCYGYFSKASDGAAWLYGVANGMTGYCHSGYLG